MEITERVSYLKGLAEGLQLNESSKEGKVLVQIIDILDDIALELEDIKDEQFDLEEGLDAVSDDLSDVEDFIDEYFDLDDEDFDEDDFDYDEDELDELDDEEEDCYGTTCPDCEEEIFFDESVLEDGFVECPNCGARLEFDPEDILGDESCEGCKGCDK